MMRLLLCLMLVACSSGCATLVKGKEQDIGISSSPVGAQVTVEGEQYTTPAVIRLRRNRSHVLVFEKEGYETSSGTVTSRFTPGWLVGNIIFFIAAPAGLVIDMMTGSSYELEPDTVHVSMTQLR